MNVEEDLLLPLPRVMDSTHAESWLRSEARSGRSHNTIAAYGRGLEEYFSFCERHGIEAETATREHIALYVRYLCSRRKAQRSGAKHKSPVPPEGLSNATVQQRLVSIRLFHDFLVEEGVRENNPVGRGRYSPGNSFGGERGLVPRYTKLPWIPSDEQWQRILAQMQAEPLRNRFMLALAYDGALRREELCALETGDLDPARRLLRVRAETTKGRQERVVPYSEATAELYRAYLTVRREISRASGPILLSESRRNRGTPITIWTWSKVIKAVAVRSGVDHLSTHTFRHLCLTDLARTGWDIHEIARFAGHKSTDTTQCYIHLSGRELALKVERGMAQIRDWRIAAMANGSNQP